MGTYLVEISIFNGDDEHRLCIAENPEQAEKKVRNWYEKNSFLRINYVVVLETII